MFEIQIKKERAQRLMRNALRGISTPAAKATPGEFLV